MKILLYKPESNTGAYKFIADVEKYYLESHNKITVLHDGMADEFEFIRVIDATWSDNTKYGKREFVVKLEVKESKKEEVPQFA